MDLEFLLIQMDRNSMVNGNAIIGMDMALKFMKMVINTRVISNMILDMAKEPTYIKMEI